MIKTIGFLFSMFAFGLAHAQDMIVADAPLPEPNYVAIVIFLVLMFGSIGWFAWRVIKNKDTEK